MVDTFWSKEVKGRLENKISRQYLSFLPVALEQKLKKSR